ncbi:MAG: hypothetical protein FIB05_07215 [Betaproteobacteria bacterium]|nr:hypothetical protein [Betaproteobacteria bacterium]PWB65165.1 MAG: hypothetical protein C3F16_03050 [Betaproteobacteria bacterium]
MKPILLATALALGSLAAFAQAPAPEAAPAAAATPGIPPFQCDPKPVYPGIDNIKSEADLDKLKATVKKYQDCVKAYVTERNATSKAHTEAGNAAVREHNAVMKKFVDDQEAAKKAQEGK